MPDAVVAIIIIAILSGTAVKMTSMFLNHRRESKRLTTGGNSDSSIRTSELQDMMRRAVSEAVEPLEKRLDELQTSRQLSAAKEQPQLAARNDSDHDDAAEMTESHS